MRAARRGKVKTEVVGVWPDTTDRHRAGQPLRVVRTPYTVQRARWDRRPHPVAPPLIERNRADLTAYSRELWERVKAGELTSADHDRLWNARSNEQYRAELRTAEGLAYYGRVWPVSRRYQRSVRKETELIRADRRDRTRVPALRAEYGRRKR